MIVDVHAHVIVPGLGAEVERRAGVQVVRYGGREIRSAVREFSAVARIVEEQDRAGVDVVVLCPWVNLCGVEVERQNEALASYVSERVLVLGTVDPAVPEQLRELASDGRLAGVEVPAAPGGVFLGDDRFRDFWAAAAEAGVLVFVHPSTRGFGLPVLEEHYLWNTLGNPFETTVTAAHMLAAGVLDEHPGLQVLLAHGGGVLAALRGRLAHEQAIHGGQSLGTGPRNLRDETVKGAAPARSTTRDRPLARDVSVSGDCPPRDVRDAIRRFHVDTVVHDVDVLRGLVAFFGPEHVLLGSDYPFDMGVVRPAEIVRALGLDPDDEAKILGGNALGLLRQESPA
jgi:aminocarboxymuconate-semialdehyde decarboxylase